MRMLTTENLKQLCIGAAMLGSGGGGDIALLEPLVHECLLRYGPVPLMQISELQPHHLVVPVAFVGSPEATRQRGVSSDMFAQLLDAITKDNPERSLVLMPAEIGGCNALTPFVVAGALSLPVLDADLIGRAFPKVSMCKPAVTLQGQSITSYMGSNTGECVKYIARDMDDLERHARDVAMQYGGSAAIAVFIFDAANVEQVVISGSVSRAVELASSLQNLKLSELTTGRVSGLITRNESGFFYGACRIEVPGHDLHLFFQNEYLYLEQNGKAFAESPDLIVLLDAESRLPVASESLRNAMQVIVLTLEAPLFWYSPSAQNIVALDQFELCSIPLRQQEAL